MQNKMIQELIVKILEKSITTFSSTTKSLSTIELQREIKGRWDEIKSYPEWNEYIKEIDLVTNKEISIRLLDKSESLTRGILRYDEMCEVLENDIANFKEQDVICKRLFVMKDYIQDMFPLYGNNDIKDQIVRSRGLVLSAIAGLQNVGGKFKEPTNE